jgi:hypothetical protein
VHPGDVRLEHCGVLRQPRGADGGDAHRPRLALVLQREAGRLYRGEQREHDVQPFERRSEEPAVVLREAGHDLAAAADAAKRLRREGRAAARRRRARVDHVA